MILDEQALFALIKRAVDEVLAERDLKPANAELVSPETFAERRDLCAATVRAMIRDGRLAAVKVGRQYRIASDAAIGEPVKPAARPLAASPKDAIADAALRIVGGRR